MIGKHEWFKRRKYGGWGFFPATWQGWVYIAVVIGLIFFIQNLPISKTAVMVATGILGVIMMIDAIDIMVRMKQDERETRHEAMAERNALWVIIIILTAGVAYQAAQSAALGEGLAIDPVIIVAIAVGLVAKAATNYYLDKKD